MTDADAPSLDETTVRDFLQRTPDFLARNLDLLDRMAVPGHSTGDGVIDMQQFILERLRGEIDHLRTCANDLIVTSRGNMMIQARTHAAVLGLVGAGDLDQMMRLIVSDLPLLLDLDAASLCLEETGGWTAARAPLIRPLYAGSVDRLLGPERDILSVQDFVDDGSIFGPNARLIRSAAIARLRPGRNTPPGLFALGSRSFGTFQPDQASDLFNFLVRVVERCLHRWLEGA